MNIINHFSPFQYVSHKAYSGFWNYAFNTFFKGIGAKIISGLSLFIAFWLLIKKESIYGFTAAFLISIFFAYLSGIFNLSWRFF